MLNLGATTSFLMGAGAKLGASFGNATKNISQTVQKFSNTFSVSNSVSRSPLASAVSKAVVNPINLFTNPFMAVSSVVGQKAGATVKGALSSANKTGGMLSGALSIWNRGLDSINSVSDVISSTKNAVGNLKNALGISVQDDETGVKATGASAFSWLPLPLDLLGLSLQPRDTAPTSGYTSISSLPASSDFSGSKPETISQPQTNWMPILVVSVIALGAFTLLRK